MKRLLVTALAFASTAVFADVGELPKADFFSGEQSLVSTPFVTEDGQYRVCKSRLGSRTFVKQNMCLWEEPIPQNELLGKNSVAGLQVERGDVETVESFLARSIAEPKPHIVHVRASWPGALVIYSRDRMGLDNPF